MDYPFNLKGILNFPKLKNEFELVEGKVKLYNNQVFVADNIKEVIPEFLQSDFNLSATFLTICLEILLTSLSFCKKLLDTLRKLQIN